MKHISISIKRPFAEVYSFIANPENLAQWASGLGESLRQAGDTWTAQTPHGEVKIRFVPQNNFGILDHWVTLANGIEIYNPMRVLENGMRCEVVFTLFRHPGMTDEQFEGDADWIARDLETLQSLLEGRGK